MSGYREVLDAMCRRFEIQAISASGSGKEEIRDLFSGKRSAIPTGSSDVDIGVLPVTDRRLSVRDKVDLTSTLEDLLGVDRVDLVSLGDADPFLALDIIRGERLYAHDEYLADEYDLFVLARAADLEHWERERIASILGEKP